LALPFHWIIRRELRSVLNKVLLKIVRLDANFDKIDPENINRILLVRLNYRIGNILFMTPLLRAIETLMPHVKVDMLIGAAYIKPIVKDMPNVNNVYDAPRKLLKSPIQLIKFANKLNKNNYDIVISPVNGSVSSNIALLLLKSPIKLGIYNKDSYSPLNRFVYPKKEYKHSALQPLAIMDIFTQEKEYNKYLDIALSKDEKEFGKNYLDNLLKDNNIEKTDKKIIAIFKDARNDKKIPNSWWIEYIDNISKKDKNIVFIDILNPNETKPLKDGMLYLKEKNLRILGSIFSAFDRFICADTGPMHLASASLVPVIALFNITSPDTFGPLGKNDKVLMINDQDIDLLCTKTIQMIL